MSTQIAKGAAWMLAFKLADRALGLISTVILARLLLPADFGLVAMAMSIIAIVELASAFSFEMALIQRRDTTREYFDTAWTLNVIAGVACGAIMMLLAHPAAAFYSEPRLTATIIVLSLAWIIQGFENVGVVAFRKDLTFRKEFIWLTSKKIAAFAVTIPLAFLWRDQWALVAGTLAGRLTGVAMSYGMHPFRPRFGLSAGRDLFSFSGWLALNNAVAFTYGRLAHFFVGKLHGTSALGIYTLAEQIANLATTELVQPINRAVFPGYAKMADDKSRLRDGFLGVIGVVAAFVLPAGVGVAVTAEVAVDVLLGPRWSATVPVIQVLAISAAICALGTNIFSAYVSLGLTRLPTLLATARLIILIPLMLVLSHYAGFIGIAYADLATAVIYLCVNYPTLFRVMNIRFVQYLSHVWRPAVAAAAMSAVLLFIDRRLLAPEGVAAMHAVTRFALLIAAGMASYIAVLLALWWSCGRPDGVERQALILGRRWLPAPKPAG